MKLHLLNNYYTQKNCFSPTAIGSSSFYEDSSLFIFFIVVFVTYVIYNLDQRDDSEEYLELDKFLLKFLGAITYKSHDFYINKISELTHVYTVTVTENIETNKLQVLLIILYLKNLTILFIKIFFGSSIK
jgi:hypothetical protein